MNAFAKFFILLAMIFVAMWLVSVIFPAQSSTIQILIGAAIVAAIDIWVLDRKTTVVYGKGFRNA